MRKLVLALLLGACAGTAFAGQVPAPINAPPSVAAGDLLAASGTNPQQAADSGLAPSAVVTLTGAQTLTNKTLASPILVTPNLGTPSAINLANATNLSLSALATETANLVLAGPSSGASATPTFRSLVVADIPSLSSLYDLTGAAATAQSNAEAYAANASNLASGTVPAARLPAPVATALGGVKSIACPTYQVLTSISTAGAPGCANPGPGGRSYSSVANPVAPASTSSFAMQGLAGSITPEITGVVEITVTGYIIDNGSGAVGTGIEGLIYYGTGSAPANGAAASGSLCGNTSVLYELAAASSAANVAQPFPLVCQATLSAGTTYWIDIVAKSLGSASAMAFSNVAISAKELR